MSFKETMVEEASCIEVIFKTFIENKKKMNYFLFFEGKDDGKYYGIRFVDISGRDECVSYSCDGKKNVIDIYWKIKKDTVGDKNKSLLFFVDRDFDKYLELPDDIYVTDGYSIENYYFTDKAIRNLLIYEFNFQLSKKDDIEDFKKSLEFLKKERDLAIKKIIYTNAWYSLQVNKAYVQKIPKPKLYNIKEYSKIEGINCIPDLESKVEDYISVSEKEIEEEIKYLNEDPVMRIRGKYFEQIMSKKIEELFKDSNKRSGHKILSKRRRNCLVINKDSIISLFSQYADTPDSLRKYIIKMTK